MLSKAKFDMAARSKLVVANGVLVACMDDPSLKLFMGSNQSQRGC